MSVLEIKQQISRLTLSQRQEVQQYLIALKRTSPVWKRSTARKIRDMQAGKEGTSIEELEARHTRG
ncbi:hypothetical protein Ga0100231_002405 [Opitutaceae bacterium TAV4]|nr:hypothetical protein Ga0100231_002405 [Opitutaceae bacterium TAV4]RRJ99989.1 hypothetical protein Ga0100230_018480 [Opitutaceae bacterium TAV3]